MSISACEICSKLCDEDKGEDETCSECGLVVCQDHVDFEKEAPICTECSRKDKNEKPNKIME